MKASWQGSYELPEELDFTKLKRIPNPFTQTFRDLNLVCLAEDVKAAFPDSDAVNKALRELLQHRQAVEQEHTEAAKNRDLPVRNAGAADHVDALAGHADAAA